MKLSQQKTPNLNREENRAVLAFFGAADFFEIELKDAETQKKKDENVPKSGNFEFRIEVQNFEMKVD